MINTFILLAKTHFLARNAARLSGKTAICLLVLCFSFSVGGNVFAQDAELVRNIIASSFSMENMKQALVTEFEDRPGDFVAAIDGLDDKNDLDPEVRKMLQDTLNELFGQEDYLAFVSSYSETSGTGVRKIMAGALKNNNALILSLQEDPQPVLTLLENEARSMSAVRTLGELLSAGQIQAAGPVIQSKLQLPQLDAGTRYYLEIGSVRLGNLETLEKYAAMLGSTHITDINHALNIFAKSGSTKVMKYLIPWLDRTDSPDVSVGEDAIFARIVPFRYADVAVHFANHFRAGNTGPISLEGLALLSYSNEDILETRQWWETVKDTDPYQ